MTSTKRTDQHRPAEFIPEDYELVGYFQNYEYQDEAVYNNEWQRNERNRLRALVFNSTTTAYHSCDQCDHCGARINYAVVMRHVLTGDYLAVGETCASGRFEYSKAEFDRMRKNAELDRQAMRIKAQWEQYKADNACDWDELYASDNSFVQDVLRRGRSNGSISERQFNAIINAVSRDKENAARIAAEPEVIKTPAPIGRATVTGAILAFKDVESDYGITTKMLVECTTPDGVFKVWGTCPSALICRKGDVITFSGNFTQATDDPFFAFFKRPTKASVVTEADDDGV